METILFHLLPYVLIFLNSVPVALSIGLRCNSSGPSCPSLISYIPTTPTNFSTIVNLFELKSYRNLLGANAWELSVPENTTIPANGIVKVPITCFCSNGTGTSKNGPIYTVKKDDTLFLIAHDNYGGLLNYSDIVDVNVEIKDPNKIYVGQKFRIPLPCSCQSERETNAMANVSFSSSMIHYSYMVQKGNSLAGIAAEMGSNSSELMMVNNIMDPTKLLAGQILDIPLKACSSNISKSSTDGNLLVANGTYVITAENCLQCSCGPSDSDLYCAPAPLGATCPSMQCTNSNLMIGNFTTQPLSVGCNVTECSYNGYVNNKILTTLETSLQPQCPAKHILPALTTPSSTLQAPPPAILSPGISPNGSPGMSPNGSPSSSVPGLSSSPPSPSGSTNSMAVEPLQSFSFATMLVLGIPFLIHFAEL